MENHVVLNFREKKGFGIVLEVGFKQMWGICTSFYESSFVFIISFYCDLLKKKQNKEKKRKNKRKEKREYKKQKKKMYRQRKTEEKNAIKVFWFIFILVSSFYFNFVVLHFVFFCF